MSGLGARIVRLEAATRRRRPDRCDRCRREHADVALGLDRLQARYAGEPLPAAVICACSCCAPLLADLAARYAAGRPDRGDGPWAS